MDRILEKALVTIEEMLEDRNYIPLETKVEIDIILRMNKKKYITESNKLVLVVIISSTSAIKNYSKYIENDSYETIIFVYLNNINISHKNIEKNLNYKIEIWSVYNLLFNISKHELQPKIEKIILTKKFGNLPKISFYDPLIRYYRFQHKDIIKIMHHDNSISIRIVN